MWVLTEEYNDYDQHGEYFIRCWVDYPSIEEVTATLKREGNNDEELFAHVFSGGGRIKHEDFWYHFRQTKDGY